MGRLFFAFILLAFAVPAHARDYYMSQAGRGTGASCSNPLSVAWFNTTGSRLGAGNTVHLCGVFSGGVGQQMLVVRSSGLTIKFEAGSRLTSPAWSGLGAINAQGLSNVVVDGSGVGVIENTANGTTRAHRLSSVAVYMRGCNGCVVKNITISNLYVHSSVSDTTVRQTAVNCVNFVSANNVVLDHITCHDAGWAFAGMGNNFTLSNSDIYNIDHGLAFGAVGTTSGFSIHDNHIHNFTNWDTTTNAYHHDGIHMWGQSGRVTNGAIYNNRFDGDSGVNITGFIFLQDSVQHVAVYNNVFNTPTSRVMRSIWFEATSTSMPNGPATGNSAHNNTANAGTHREGSGLMIDNQLNFTGYNNVLMGGQSDVSIRGGTTLTGLNNNVYVDLGSYGDRNTFGYKGASYQTLTQWKNVCRCDGSSRFVTAAQVSLSSTGQITIRSAAASAGTNLTGIATGALSSINTDIIGAARPASGSWDAGAFQTGSTPAKPAPVGGVTAKVN